MDLRRITHFLAVVDHGTVTGAAAALRIAQPALSQSLRTLERELGTTLFVRGGRRLTLTADGQALLDPARRILRGVADARQAVAGSPVAAAPPLTVALHDPLIPEVTPALAAVRAEFPDVPLRLHTATDEDDLTRHLHGGCCELGVAYLPLRRDGIASVPVGRQAVWAIVPPHCELPDPAPLAALHGLPLIDSIHGFAAARDAIRSALDRHQVTLRPVLRSAHRGAITSLAAAGIGLAFVSRQNARQAAGQGAAVRRLEPPIEVEYGLLTAHGGDRSAAARRLAALLTG